MNLEEINNTIEALEASSTTFGNCEKLASLYICRDHMDKTKSDKVEKEIDDILPQYQRYRQIKRKYQLHELPEESVTVSIKRVCREISEFIQTLYSCTDLEEERIQLKSMIETLQEI